MAKFLAIHTLPAPVTPEEAAPLGKKAKANATADAYWVKSWVQLNEEGKMVKIYCEWNGKDADTVRKVLDKTPELPLDGLYPMVVVDSEDFR